MPPTPIQFNYQIPHKHLPQDSSMSPLIATSVINYRKSYSHKSDILHYYHCRGKTKPIFYSSKFIDYRQSQKRLPITQEITKHPPRMYILTYQYSPNDRSHCVIMHILHKFSNLPNKLSFQNYGKCTKCQNPNNRFYKIQFL